MINHPLVLVGGEECGGDNSKVLGVWGVDHKACRGVRREGVQGVTGDPPLQILMIFIALVFSVHVHSTIATST